MEGKFETNKSKEMARTAIEALKDKKGEDIRIIDISNVSVIADYFIIVTGSNPNHVQTLSDNVQEKLGREGYTTDRIEGFQGASWILMDYNDIIIHIFSREDRLFYDLERIWRDGRFIDESEL